MTHIKFSLLLLVLLMGMSACVTTQKFEEVQNERDQYKEEAENMKILQEENRLLRTDLNEAEKQVRDLVLKNEELLVRTNKLEAANEDLLNRYDNLLDQNKAMLATSSSERQALLEELADKQAALDAKERELENLISELENREINLDDLQESLAAREARMTEMESKLNYQEAQLAALKESIDEALLGFSSTDFSVAEKDGKLYVSLSQNLLFKSGSARIDSEGKRAIRQLADALLANPDMEILVEGHTDSDGSASRNWDLSTDRATAVVQVLVDEGIDPTRITAAGRAFYDPIAPNDSEANKARNRRTEVILTPNLDKLYDIIEE